MVRGRFWQTIIAVLVLVTQGLFDLSPVVAIAFAPTPVHAAEEEKKAVAICQCVHCQGGEKCCCETAESPTDAMVFRAVCDTPEDAVYQRTLIPRALPLSVELPLRPDLIPSIAPAFGATPLPGGRTPTPPTQPPCFG